MANIITGSRILGSVLLLTLPVFSPAFYIIYLYCGFTDIIDGAVARMTNRVSRFGSQFDTAADFVFVTVCLIKLLPAVNIPFVLSVWVLIIFVIKCANFLYGMLILRQFATEHNAANKITGFLLFLLPFTLAFVDIKYSGTAVCFIATYAAIKESCIIRI